MGGWRTEPGVVELPDGRRIRATGLRRPRGDVPVPDLAVYLLGRDPHVGGWPYRWVRWRDFGVPRSTEDAVDALREAHGRAASGRVEIACGGGVGRTGTALCVLAVLSGVDVDDAVGWVSEHHHRRAVETAGSGAGSPRWHHSSAAEPDRLCLPSRPGRCTGPLSRHRRGGRPLDSLASPLLTPRDP